MHATLSADRTLCNYLNINEYLDKKSLVALKLLFIK